MGDLKIYIDEDYVSIKEALDIITDDFVDDGHCCNQTIIDLRDALKSVLKERDMFEKKYSNLVIGMTYLSGLVDEDTCKKIDEILDAE